MSDSNELLHVSFYKFVRIADPEAFAQQLREMSAGLSGLILVATEGINGALAGSPAALEAFESALCSQFSELFSDLYFKHSACKTTPFDRFKVHVKAEILPLGVKGIDAINRRGIPVSPQDWRELIAQDDVVLIDNRNSFEYRLGRFNNAIDPKVGNFRDFPRYIQDNVETWKAEGKRVAMYCTGGIRCEKTAAWMLDMDMPVYELDGGILNYFMQMPDAEKDWQGECFVFDNRIAIDTHMQETKTCAEQVYNDEPSEKWRLARAQRLDQDGASAAASKSDSATDQDDD